MQKPHPHRISLQGLPPSVVPPSSSHPSPIPSSSTSPSPHTLIPVSSFGPPSPTSSTSSSPRMSSRLSLTDFNNNFPSIDELDEMEGLKITMPNSTSTSASTSVLHPMATGSSRHSQTNGRVDRTSPVRQDSPVTPVKPFPVFPMDMAPRPSSTPIPTVDAFNSRPASPIHDRSPLSPTVPRKPTNLALNASVSPSRSPLIPQITPEKRELPTAFFPHTLHEFLGDHSVLILDVRPRGDFEKGHIKAQAVVCIEPTVLLRERYVSPFYNCMNLSDHCL